MYIRTKDEVYDSEKNNDKYLLDMVFEKIINQSENLEELCDEFVYINKVENMEKSHIVFEMSNRITEPTTKQKMDYIKKYYKDELDKIRGAIYTDKGLIYVAKMNENGELVLI